MLVNGINYHFSSVRSAQISLLSSTDEAEIAEAIRWMNDHYQQIAEDQSRYEHNIWTDHVRSIFLPVKNLWNEYLRQLGSFNNDILQKR